MSPELYWLPAPPADWRERLKRLAAAAGNRGASDDGAKGGRAWDEHAWNEAVSLAKHCLNFQQTNALATVVGTTFPHGYSGSAGTKPERLALFSSSTTSHLQPGLRVAALRRGIWLDIYENEYGQYRQELLAPDAALTAFQPTAVLFCLDASHVCSGLHQAHDQAGAEACLDEVVATLRELWRTAQTRFGCVVLQQTIMNRHAAVLGNNEHRYALSPAAFTSSLNERLRAEADKAGVDMIALDSRMARDGLAVWHSAPFWLKAKQEVSLTAAPMFGELAMRTLAAKQGRVAKCCVLDLDNTLWGGVIGDDGVGGIVIGQGSALGEAHLAVQSYAQQLLERGILLAVCSKNDEQIARSAFSLPDMILKEADISCFVANWNDKASNLRLIANSLNIGLDALVFVDDNPFERNLVRSELPMVAVPELPVEIELAPACLADAGYFESTGVTTEDLARRRYYAEGRRTVDISATGGDLTDYLAGLDMTLLCGPVEARNLTRVVQLINKTNQFNLTTRRYSEQQLLATLDEPGVLCQQFRLLDRFGDNGIIAVVIGRRIEETTIEIDTWLMSCRVLGRTVEQATLNVIAQLALRAGATALIGTYRPTPKNGIVRELFQTLGFRQVAHSESETRAELDLASYVPRPTPVTISEAAP